MVELFHLESLADLYKPRRVMKYVLIWCSSGSVTLAVDEEDFELNPNDVITITSGQIHYCKHVKEARGYMLEFTLDFFCKDDTDIELVFHNGLFCHFAINEVILVENHRKMEEQLKLIEEELLQKPYQYLTSIRARIELILVEINRVKVNRGDEIYKPDALFLRLLELVRDNYAHNYSLQHFALLLGTTEAKLNGLAKLHTGKTAQNVIYGLIVSEAKRLLIYESFTVKEVAYKLGFNDPFYFSNFFKKHAHISPKSYAGKYAI